MKLRRIAPVVAAVFCAIAAVSLVRELVALGPVRVLSMLGRQRPGVVVGALALVAVNYFVLTCQDQLAFVYVGRRLARWRIRFASFVEAFANLWLDAAPRFCTEKCHANHLSV